MDITICLNERASADIFVQSGTIFIDVWIHDEEGSIVPTT
jgi:hypothetical protein